MKFTKQPSILFIGLLMILGVSANAPAEEASEREEAKKLVIEYRDGTRQTLILDKEWWHILNVLLPTTPAPLREDKQGQPAAKGPPSPRRELRDRRDHRGKRLERNLVITGNRGRISI